MAGKQKKGNILVVFAGDPETRPVKVLGILWGEVSEEITLHKHMHRMHNCII